jgi:hypothetical protein
MGGVRANGRNRQNRMKRTAHSKRRLADNINNLKQSGNSTSRLGAKTRLLLLLAFF